MSNQLHLGAVLFPQNTTWPEMVKAARRIDDLGYEHLWTWDHLYAALGDPYRPIVEGWTALAGLAGVTRRVRLGLLVGANPFRNPGLMAKTVSTLDHVSGGRSILGVGGAWFGLEHHAHGLEFGSGLGERLDWLDEAVGAIRRLLDGETVTSPPGGHYHFDKLRHSPLPLQRHLPIMIGGSGERKTLLTVARYADMWNHSGKPELARHKSDVLDQHCAAVGRDPASIERTIEARIVVRDDENEARRIYQSVMALNGGPSEDDDDGWLGPPSKIAERMRAFAANGFSTILCEFPAPYDLETVERLITDVRPLVTETSTV